MNQLILKIMQGESLHHICKQKDMPSLETVCKMLTSSAEDDLEFKRQFDIATEFRQKMIEDKILEIADDDSDITIETEKGPVPNRARFMQRKIMIDTRMKLLLQYKKELKELEKQKEKQALLHEKKQKSQKKEEEDYEYIPDSDEPLVYAPAAELKDDCCYIPLIYNEHIPSAYQKTAPAQYDPERTPPYNQHPELRKGLRWQRIDIEKYPRFRHPGENIRYFLPVRTAQYQPELDFVPNN